MDVGAAPQKLDADWQSVRAEPHAKERFAAQFLAEHAPALSLGEGRKWAMRDLGAGWSALVQLCPELETLKDRVNDWLTASGAPS